MIDINNRWLFVAVSLGKIYFNDVKPWHLVNSMLVEISLCRHESSLLLGIGDRSSRCAVLQGGIRIERSCFDLNEDNILFVLSNDIYLVVRGMKISLNNLIPFGLEIIARDILAVSSYLSRSVFSFILHLKIL